MPFLTSRHLACLEGTPLRHEIDDDFGGLVGIADGGDAAVHFLGRDVAAEGEGFGGSEGLAERGRSGRGFVFLDEVFDEPVFEDGGGDGADLARGGAGGDGGESLTVGCGEEGREAGVAGEGVDLLAAVEVGGHFVLRVADGFLELRGDFLYVVEGVGEISWGVWLMAGRAGDGCPNGVDSRPQARLSFPIRSAVPGGACFRVARIPTGAPPVSARQMATLRPSEWLPGSRFTRDAEIMAYRAQAGR